MGHVHVKHPGEMSKREFECGVQTRGLGVLGSVRLAGGSSKPRGWLREVEGSPEKSRGGRETGTEGKRRGNSWEEEFKRAPWKLLVTFTD